jgi:hypothetical protein
MDAEHHAVRPVQTAHAYLSGQAYQSRRRLGCHAHLMKVAAYQAPLLSNGSIEALGLIADRVRTCEAAGVAILCCPEALIGGLADYSPRPADVALSVESGQLSAMLRPIASQTVTTIVGFTELGPDRQLFNSAAILRHGQIVGLYRKLHPAINRSVYRPGTSTPIFRVDGLTFGILICRDSTYPELSRTQRTTLSRRRRAEPASSKTRDERTSTSRRRTVCQWFERTLPGRPTAWSHTDPPGSLGTMESPCRRPGGWGPTF